MQPLGAEPLEGHTVYEKVRTIGKGQRSFVQVAKNKVTGELVAIRFIPRGNLTANSVALGANMRHVEFEPMHAICMFHDVEHRMGTEPHQVRHEVRVWMNSYPVGGFGCAFRASHGMQVCMHMCACTRAARLTAVWPAASQGTYATPPHRIINPALCELASSAL